MAVRQITGPWGQVDVLVERNTDGQWYAVLRQAPPDLAYVSGTVAEDEAEAVALLRYQCLRAFGER